MERINEYQARLESNPRLGRGTVNNYLIAINKLISKYGEDPTIQEINAFIKDRCDRRQAWAKYALKEYLAMVGRIADYYQLVQARIKKPSRPKVFLTKAKLMEIVDKIEKEPYRTIAKIQAATAARARGIITIERRKVRIEEEWIKIILREKGDKPTATYLKKEFWKYLEPFHAQRNVYLFLEKEAARYNEERLRIRINTVYYRYRERLQEAAKKCGVIMATHDIRRSMANLIDINSGDIRITQGVLDHESSDTTKRYLRDNSKQIARALLQQQEGME